MDLLLTEVELMLRASVRDYMEREVAPIAAELDEREEFSHGVFQGLAKLELLRIGIPQEWGGAGGGYKELTVAIEELARVDLATSTTYIVHLSLATQTINLAGTPEQCQQYIPPLVRGEKIGAFCYTEAEAGSDAAAISTQASRRNGTYVLNGSKLFISNGSVADTYVVFATQDRALRSQGIGCFVVERGTKGLTATKLLGKMGIRASDTAELAFQECVIPQENRLGEEGEGFKIAMKIVDSSRICIAAQAVGLAQGALEAAVRYIKEREQFGRPIAEFQGVQWQIAELATNVDAARLLTRRAALLRDAGQPHGTEAAMAKLFASRVATQAASTAVQLHGGSGYFKGNPVERMYRDAKITEIYEGTSEIQRLVIARSLLGQACPRGLADQKWYHSRNSSA